MPRTPSTDLQYLSGFANEFASEALPGSLPQGCNSPQQVPRGLYAEQLSGTAFTMPRHEQRRSWLYRIRPSALHPRFERLARQPLIAAGALPTPNRLRWNPQPLPTEPTDFIDGSRRCPEWCEHLPVRRQPLDAARFL